MANFRTHIGLGVVVGVAFIAMGLLYSLFSAPEYIVWIFLAVIVGSFLPDLDLDGGVPFQILFGILSAGFAGLAFLSVYQEGEGEVVALAATPILVFLTVRFVGGYIFEKFTNHRGIFHSVPAALLFGLVVIWIFHMLSMLEGKELYVGLAVTSGYLGHLILDEIYSSIDIKGHSIFPKKSHGNALKFKSSSKMATFSFYALILFLAATLPEARQILEISKSFF